MTLFDPRITPARADIAAAELKGKLAAERFVEGRNAQAAKGAVALRKRPADDAPLETQILYGERFTVYEEKNGWVWGQAAQDKYVGYAHAEFFVAQASEPSHRVTALFTPLLPAPDIKTAHHDLLPMNAKVSVVGEENRYASLGGGGYVFTGHLGAIAVSASDWVAVTERFVGAPYLWGGKTVAGVDCSGLVQIALEAGGVAAPRDTDMMEAALGTAISSTDLSQLRRGDLVFWKGHMGVMLDGTRLLHANAFAMQVTIEPLVQAAERIAAADGAIRTVKRLP